MSVSNKTLRNQKIQLLITDVGMNLQGSAYTDVWKNLLQFSADKHECEVLKDLLSNTERFDGAEKPCQAGTFQVLGDSNYYNVDLYWPIAKVMIFTSENEEEYDIASKSEWKCFYLGADNVTANDIVKILRKK